LRAQQQRRSVGGVDLPTLVLDALRLALWLSAPALGACFVLALITGFFQSASASSDPSLGFVPKLLAVGAALWLERGFLSAHMLEFSARMLREMARLGQ
jgi:flagellar biosynthesis protein FliQ